IPNDTRISSECRDLLEGLLQRDPHKRISFKDFFRHPFIFIDLSSQISRADEFLHKSIHYEQSGNFKKALDYRVRALDEYVAIIKVDEDDNRRHQLRSKVKQGLVAAEALKRRMRETHSNSASIVPTTTTTTTVSPPENFNLNHNKELSDAYQHCLNGNQLVNTNTFFCK
ncbi:unnamed protein product, partial [Adineta steineri]